MSLNKNLLAQNQTSEHVIFCCSLYDSNDFSRNNVIDIPYANSKDSTDFKDFKISLSATLHGKCRRMNMNVYDDHICVPFSST